MTDNVELLRGLLVLPVILPGLALGTWVGGRMFVPPGSGLAPSAECLKLHPEWRETLDAGPRILRERGKGDGCL